MPASHAFQYPGIHAPRVFCFRINSWPRKTTYRVMLDRRIVGHVFEHTTTNPPHYTVLLGRGVGVERTDDRFASGEQAVKRVVDAAIERQPTAPEAYYPVIDSQRVFEVLTGRRLPQAGNRKS